MDTRNSRFTQVSIQLLFLFNLRTGENWGQHGSFNTASVLIQQYYARYLDCNYRFQYSFCSYSTRKMVHCQRCSLFQYSFCSYSTKMWRKNFQQRKVSIRLLFLFNQAYIEYIKENSKVSIQLLFLFNSSNMGKSGRILVSIQLLFLFNEKLQSTCVHNFGVSIQLLFLFNM